MKMYYYEKECAERPALNLDLVGGRMSKWTSVLAGVINGIDRSNIRTLTDELAGHDTNMILDE